VCPKSNQISIKTNSMHVAERLYLCSFEWTLAHLFKIEEWRLILISNIHTGVERFVRGKWND